MEYTAADSFRHDRVPSIGVLVANLGTPEAPTAAAVRPYLRQFLTDRRVIDLPRWKWRPILELFVLTTRPKTSAHAYQQVWTAEGSPLLVYTRRQAAGIAARLEATVSSPVRVAAAMTYGEPSVGAALRELREAGCDRILVLSMYPQYSGTTTGPVFDAVARELTTWRVVPELRTIGRYHDEPGYVRALAASIRERWEQDGEPEKLLFSFHGIPRSYFEGGDPYHCMCHKTARLVAEELGLGDGGNTGDPAARWVVAFQSLFGREEWIKPYTASTITAMGKAGVKSLDVICPGFSADCLETIEEIDIQNREFFLAAGGERFRYIPALNDRPDHLDFLASLVRRHLQGWAEGPEGWDGEAAEREARDAARRAEEMAAAGVTETAGY